jgi:NDP-sugar pyrophosphorylase family protein
MVLDLTVIATVGGEGTRLYPLTLDKPKCLVNLVGRAIVARTFESLAMQGCREFIIASKGAEITQRLKEYFKDGAGFSSRLKLDPPAVFRYQNNYLDKGSADSLRHNLERYDIRRDTLVIAGDSVFELPLEEMLRYHQEKGGVATIGLKRIEGDLSPYGVAKVDENMRIEKFVEKPKPGQAPSNLVNTAIYLFSPEIREILQRMGERAKDIGGDLLPYLAENGYPVYGFEIKGYWTDIGTPENYLNTTQTILHESVKLFPLGESVAPGLWIHHTTWEAIKRKVEKGRIILKPPVKIGADCRIGEGVVIESSFIGDCVDIGDNTHILGSVVLDFTNVGRNVRLNSTIVGEYAHIGDGSIIDKNLPVEFASGSPDMVPVIGNNVSVFERSVLGPKKRVCQLRDSMKVLITGRFRELGYDSRNLYFMEI